MIVPQIGREARRRRPGKLPFPDFPGWKPYALSPPLATVVQIDGLRCGGGELFIQEFQPQPTEDVIDDRFGDGDVAIVGVTGRSRIARGQISRPRP